MMNTKIELLKGDITKVAADALVNSSNTALISRSDGGVNGAIYQAGGEEISDACQKVILQLGECPTGEAVMTPAGNIGVRFIIHAVGPVWKGGENNEEALLEKTYQSILKVSDDEGLETIAIPNISTGAYSFPKEMAAEIAISVVTNHLEKGESTLKRIFFVCHNEDNYNIYQNMLQAK